MEWNRLWSPPHTLRCPTSNSLGPISRPTQPKYNNSLHYTRYTMVPKLLPPHQPILRHTCICSLFPRHLILYRTPCTHPHHHTTHTTPRHTYTLYTSPKYYLPSCHSSTTISTHYNHSKNPSLPLPTNLRHPSSHPSQP